MLRSNVLKAAVIVLTLFFPVCPALSMTHDTPIPQHKPKSPPAQAIRHDPPPKTPKTPEQPNTPKPKPKPPKPKPPKPNTPKPSKPKYHTLSGFNLNAVSPYAVLKKSDGSEARLSFSRGENGLELQDMYSGIPEGTRFIVPPNCTAYCIESHTKKISGINKRVDFAGGTRVKYEAGSEIEYTAASGLLLVPSGYKPENKFTAAKIDDPAPLPPTPPIKIKPKVQFDRRSAKPDWIKPDEVIPTYGLPKDQTNRLLEMHLEAIRMRSKDERADRYREIFSKYSDNDFLAAYYVAAAEFEMDHGYAACEWCDKALAINPKYAPAKHLKKRAEGLL